MNMTFLEGIAAHPVLTVLAVIVIGLALTVEIVGDSVAEYEHD